MGEILRRRIRQNRFDTPFQEAGLNLLVAANHVREECERAAAEFGITLPQYNVLRILRGAQPGGHPRSEIAARMLDRAPDVTRLIDRLAEKQMVERNREAADRRQSITRITEKGLALLRQIDPTMRSVFDAIERRLSTGDCEALSKICETIYGEE